MSLRIVREMVADLPYNLREQVVGYARSVEEALPDIQAEAAIELTADQQEWLVFLAGVRKIHGITVGSYWAVDNAGYLLSESGVPGVRVGGTVYTRGGEFHEGLRTCMTDLQVLLLEFGITEELLRISYSELALRIASDG